MASTRALSCFAFRTNGTGTKGGSTLFINNSMTSADIKLKCNLIISATYATRELPPKKEYVKMPERRRMKIIDKIPPVEPGLKIPKMMKDIHQMRGPELVHNKLQYGDFGIQAITGGRLDHKLCETIRLMVVRQIDDRRMFAMWRHQHLWQAVTKKGQGQRMGGGKGPIDHYVFPFRAERIILEVGGHCEFVEVQPMLKAVQKVLPFRSRIVTHDSIKAREEREKWEEENNLNPFTFKYCADNNIFGCKKILNRYDYMWYGKYK